VLARISLFVFTGDISHLFNCQSSMTVCLQPYFTCGLGEQKNPVVDVVLFNYHIVICILALFSMLRRCQKQINIPHMLDHCHSYYLIMAYLYFVLQGLRDQLRMREFSWILSSYSAKHWQNNTNHSQQRNKTSVILQRLQARQQMGSCSEQRNFNFSIIL